MKKTAAYIRISSSSQNPASQRAELQRWLDNHGYAPDCIQWFSDTETGAHTNRPALDALRKAIFAGEIETVIVWKLDRLARTMQDGINLLSDWCKQGVRVISVTQQIDLSGSTGQMVAGLLFAIGQIERDYIRERQAAGIAAAKARGVYKGGNKPPKASHSRAKELRAKGLTILEIATALGVSIRTVHRYLTK